MLRAVGATRRQVRRMVMAESLLLSVIGTAFGALAGLCKADFARGEDDAVRDACGAECAEVLFVGHFSTVCLHSGRRNALCICAVGFVCEMHTVEA